MAVNTHIITNDAAQQSVEFVILPNSMWIIKGKEGNEIANVNIDDQVKIIMATLAGNTAIHTKIAGEVPRLQQQVAHLVQALQLIVRYTETGSFIGNLDGCKEIAAKALTALSVL
jgi:hypothetical protein